MAYHYVELIAGEGIPLALATQGDTQQESMDKAMRQYHFPVSFCADLSRPTTELFERLAAAKSHTVTIVVSRLRKVIANLLKEGEHIMNDRLASGDFLVVGLRAQFMDVPLDQIPVLLEYELLPINGKLSFEFEIDEAMSFMAIMIREGMARRLKEVVEGN